MRIVSIRLEENIIKKIDEFVTKRDFKDRSELIRYAIRRLLEEWK